jgi:hypothetical protein
LSTEALAKEEASGVSADTPTRRHANRSPNHDNAICILELPRYSCSRLDGETRFQRADLVSIIADGCFTFGQPSVGNSFLLSHGLRQRSQGLPFVLWGYTELSFDLCEGAPNCTWHIECAKFANRFIAVGAAYRGSIADHSFGFDFSG